MIAKNYKKFPEALRFQREMFSNGYKNSPRIMRLMQVIFDQSPGTPDWWKCAKKRALDLAKRVKKALMGLFEKPEVLQGSKEQKEDNLNKDQVRALIKAKIYRTDVAKMSPEELSKITGQSRDEAQKTIKSCNCENA